MVRIMEAANGHLIIRSSTGVEVLNTATPMPAIPDADTWTATFTNKALSFEHMVPSGGDLGAGTFYWSARAQELTQTTLGAYPSGMPEPDFFFGQMRAKRTAGAGIGAASKKVAHLLTGALNEWSEWHPFSGSVMLETFFNNNDPAMGFRHVNVAKVGANWVLQGWTSNSFIEAPTSTFSMLTAYVFDVKLLWGLFK